MSELDSSNTCDNYACDEEIYSEDKKITVQFKTSTNENITGSYCSKVCACDAINYTEF